MYTYILSTERLYKASKYPLRHKSWIKNLLLECSSSYFEKGSKSKDDENFEHTFVDPGGSDRFTCYNSAGFRAVGCLICLFTYIGRNSSETQTMYLYEKAMTLHTKVISWQHISA